MATAVYKPGPCQYGRVRERVFCLYSYLLELRRDVRLLYRHDVGHRLNTAIPKR